MAIEVVHQVGDEWLAELAEDAAVGVVDRETARVVFRYRRATNDLLSTVAVEAGYSVHGVAVRLEERVGTLLPNGMDPDGVLDQALQAAERLRVEVAELGLTVRGGRLVTVGR